MQQDLEAENAALREYVFQLENALAHPDIVDALAYSAAKHSPSKKGGGFVGEQDRARPMVAFAFAETVRTTFNNACAYDGISPSSFVVFSENNPIAPFISYAAKEAIEAVQSGMALGYVAQEIHEGKVRAAKPLKRKKV